MVERHLLPLHRSHAPPARIEKANSEFGVVIKQEGILETWFQIEVARAASERSAGIFARGVRVMANCPSITPTI